MRKKVGTKGNQKSIYQRKKNAKQNFEGWERLRATTKCNQIHLIDKVNTHFWPTLYISDEIFTLNEQHL